MKVLLSIPHVFNPQKGSLYSSQTEEKREIKTAALQQATIGNLGRHRKRHWIHASLGKGKPIVTREMSCSDGVEIKIQIYTPPSASLAGKLTKDPDLTIIDADLKNFKKIPLLASRRLLEQADDYDFIGYLEDDLIIEDPQFFSKLKALHGAMPDQYTFIPHRCEHITGRGDVILSGDPDGGRPDLFWDTGESIKLKWATGDYIFYRATNPHSGCYFLNRRQALMVREFWEKSDWKSRFQLSGPLEQAGSGLLLPVLKLMKTKPQDYRFFMVRHHDELWKRHPFETEN